MRTTTARLTALTGAALLTALLGACGDADRADTSSSAGSDAKPASQTSSAPQDEESGSGDVQPEDDAPDAVLGSSTGQLPSDPSASTTVPLRLDVTGVERTSGDVLEVRFTVANEDPEVALEFWSTLGEDPGRYDVSGAAVLDLPDDSRYLTLLDSEGVCLCTAFSPSDTSVQAGQSAELYAQFPAPPESTTTIDFTLPGFSPVTGLEIS